MQTENKIKNSIKWISELMTTDEKQTSNKLGNREVGFCCLGLGCYTLDLDYQWDDPLEPAFTESVGLLTANGAPMGNPVTRVGSLKSLAVYNDSIRKPFSEIGEILKDNATAYFQKDVAEGINKHFNK